jgi:hypothetical protein
MSYRCEPCGSPVPAGRPRLTYSVLRTDGPLKGSILREVSVCSNCKNLLDMGVPLREIYRKEFRRPARPTRPVQATVVSKEAGGPGSSVRSGPTPPLSELLKVHQPPPRPKSWKRVAVWGDAETRVEAGVIGAFPSVEQAEAACSRFRRQFGADPAVDAWVRPQS